MTVDTPTEPTEKASSSSNSCSETNSTKNKETFWDQIADRETRLFVTPFAFEVDKSLYGRSLAKPRRRAAALLIDLFFVAIVATLLDNALTLCIGLFFLIVAIRKYLSLEKHKMRSLLSYGFLSAIFLIAFFTSQLEFFSSSENQSIEWTDLNFEEGVNSVSYTETAESLVVDDDERLSLIEIVKAALADLGLSFGYAALYFSAALAWFGGKTPGKWLMGLKVVKLDGKPITLWESFGRYGGYGAGLATGLLGFLQIYWDPNRQAIQDKIAGTVVIRDRR